ncbi:hypothetical protein ALI144C_09070 [Actinosynnema sp. ALI-1.44]|uniref:DUF4037 domain-containing protein n=1 Tax=Actinosynnema sp. ALI-1.44 TaxID=1933779 RepID=UPI00097CA5AA|nr:DUF4037 domain-containing protein [Actinosynnema sp. ALI-1.44]ONI87527.1 hypothetical protein ALI144C_09070 [Actinosynnema sp. ALI-1.44]
MRDVVIKGIELSRRFYREAVEPVLRGNFGDVPHAAARIGTGSEVLGFDTERSSDHEWGPRLQLFLSAGDSRAADVSQALSEQLPKTFLGYPTNFVATDTERIRSMSYTDGPVYHRVDVTDARTWFAENLGFDPLAEITAWLTTSTQTLAEVTGGAVFHDDIGEVTRARERLSWYPEDVWREIMARHWQAIAKKEAFVGRCGEVGDEVGSAVVAARQVRILMRLCLLMSRRYPPYAKWLGSAFAQLSLDIDFMRVLTASTWHEREAHLAVAYTRVAELHNGLNLTEPLDPATRLYYERPFQVILGDRFANALRAVV